MGSLQIRLLSSNTASILRTTKKTFSKVSDPILEADGFRAKMTEYLDLVDEKDRIIGQATRLECLKKALLHRAIVVFLLNDKQNEIYIQKRSRTVLAYGGLRCLSCTGHVTSGESYLEAAKREMMEELGIKNCELLELGKFLTPKLQVESFTEWEVITAFESTFTGSLKEIMLSDETEEGKFVTIDSFRQLIATKPEMFTPETLLAVRYFW